MVNLSDMVEQLKGENGTLKAELKTLKGLLAELEQLKAKVVYYEKIYSRLSGRSLQIAKVIHGEKIHYKSHIKAKDVQKARASGRSVKDLAKDFGVSATTIKRRLKEKAL